MELSHNPTEDGHHRRYGRDATLWCSLLAAVVVGGCVTLTSEGARVSVYQAPLDGLPPQRSMPAGCSLVTRKPSRTMPELDMEGQKDPFRKERNEAGAEGANALLVLRRMVIGRRDPECPPSSPITDCPPSFGAWFDVVIETYACTPEALAKLSALPPSTERDFGRIKLTRPSSPPDEHPDK